MENKPIVLRESYRQPFSFFPRVMILVTLGNKHFFGVEYCGKKQIESGSALSVLLSTTIYVITVVSRLRLVSPQHFDHCDDEYRCR